MRRSLIAALVAVITLAPTAQARDITGQVAYRERIALAPDAQLLVELRDAGGAVVAEARIEAAGRQVPLPFSLVAPDAGALTLRGALVVAGRIDWLSNPVAVPAGDGAVDLGLVPLTRFIPMGFSSRLDCGGTPVDLGFVGEIARMRLDGETFDLTPDRRASGARYSDGQTPETALWTKGNTALVTIRGRDLPECQPVIVPALLPLTARGNEPGWVLTLTETGYVYDGDMGARRLEGPMPAPSPGLGGTEFVASDTFRFTIDRTLCRDSMTGMPHPVTVTVTDADRVLPGCGGQPVDLIAGRWAVETVGDAPLTAGVAADITFDVAAGKVFGTGGCNRYSGGFTLTGEGLAFGALAGTMMACPDDQMATEQGFLQALARVSRFDIAADGALELFAGDTPVIRARR